MSKRGHTTSGSPTEGSQVRYLDSVNRSLMQTPVVDEAELGHTPIVDDSQVRPSADDSRQDPLPDPRTIARFTVLQRLGSGGMGVVYAAYDPQLDRRVALKLLRPKISKSKRSEAARTRLLREAQATAKLSHPNVVTVFEVGVLEGSDRIYIAMEFVKGSTLTRWMQQHPVSAQSGDPVVDPRSWKEVLELFRQAGRGLAAAHKAGIIHRDFKPDNVLIGRDGRVRVLDFGLARAEGRTGPIDRPDTFADALKSLGHSNASNVLELRLTRTGGMTGTPAYMAPEQYMHNDIDARTDQFSFCVALYEGLYGERPFVGNTVADVRKHVINGVLADEPTGTDVPQWLRRIVVRGVSVHPAERYPSMDALLAELSKDPEVSRQRNRRLVAVGVGAAGIIAIGGYGATKLFAGAPQGDQCQPAAERLAGIWDEARKREIKKAFSATKLPYAEDTWQRVHSDLNLATARWSELHDEACNPSDASESARLIELRLTCLDQRLAALKTLSGLFAHANNETVSRGMELTSGELGSVEKCNDPEDLVAREVDLPEEPEKRQQIRDVRSRIDEAELRQLAGQYISGMQLVSKLTTQADELDYHPLRAEAWFRRGALEEKLGEYAAAEGSLRTALWAAEASRNDDTAVDALTLLVTLVGVRLARLDEAEGLIDRLTAALTRMGVEDKLRVAHARNAIGRIYASRGGFKRAVDEQKKAIKLAEQFFAGRKHAVVAGFLLDLGDALNNLGRHDESFQHYERALNILEEKSGDKHPDLAAPLTSLGNLALRREDYGTSRKHFQRVLGILKSTVADDHPSRAPALYGLGVSYEHRGRWNRATKLYSNAVRIWEAAQGPDHPQLSPALMGRCRVEARRGHYSKAIADCTRAVAISESKGLGPAARAKARFELAKVTYEANGRQRGALDIAGEEGRKQAQSLAKQARQEYEQDSRANKDEIETIDNWLKEHPVVLDK